MRADSTPFHSIPWEPTDRPRRLYVGLLFCCGSSAWAYVLDWIGLEWNAQARERTLPRDKPRVIISKTGKKVRAGSARWPQICAQTAVTGSLTGCAAIDDGDGRYLRGQSFCKANGQVDATCLLTVERPQRVYGTLSNAPLNSDATADSRLSRALTVRSSVLRGQS